MVSISDNRLLRKNLMALTQSLGLKENLLWLFCQRTAKWLPACCLCRTDSDSADNIWTNYIKQLAPSFLSFFSRLFFILFKFFSKTVNVGWLLLNSSGKITMHCYYKSCIIDCFLHRPIWCILNFNWQKK